jgi:hypothetical protein
MITGFRIQKWPERCNYEKYSISVFQVVARCWQKVKKRKQKNIWSLAFVRQPGNKTEYYFPV